MICHSFDSAPVFAGALLFFCFFDCATVTKNKLGGAQVAISSTFIGMPRGINYGCHPLR